MKRIIIEIILILAIIGGCYWLWIQFFKPKEKESTAIGTTQTVYRHDTVTVTKWRDADSAFHATVQQLKAESVKKVLPKAEMQDFQNNTLKALQVGAGAVSELKKIDLVSSGQIKSADVKVAPNKIVTITYSNGFLTFKSKVDSSGKPVGNAEYTYNNKIQATDFTKKKILFFNQKPQDYTDIQSSDPNSSIDNLKVFQFPSAKKRDVLQLIWENEAQFTFNRRPDENQLNSGFLLKIFPENFVTPSVGVGYQWNYVEKTAFPYWKVGVDLNLIRVKR